MTRLARGRTIASLTLIENLFDLIGVILPGEYEAERIDPRER